PGQRRVEDTPADLPYPRAHQCRWQAHAARARRALPAAAAGRGGHARPAAAAAGDFGMAPDLPRANRRARGRYRNVWSGQLLVLRPEAVVHQLWHPDSHTEVWLETATQVLNARCTSGRTSIQRRPSDSSARSAAAT